MLLELTAAEPLGLLLAGVPALLNLGLLAYALLRLPRDRLTLAFAFFLAMLVCWQLFDLAIRASDNEATAAAWRALLRTGTFLAIASGLQFSLLVAEQDRIAMHPLAQALFYAPPVLFQSCYAAGFVTERLERVPVFGWITDQSDGGPLFTFVTVWFSVEAALIPAVLYWNVRRTRGDPEPHGAARLLAIGITVPIAIGIVTESILPQVLGIRQIPLTTTTLSFFTCAVAVALGRHDLFRVNTLAAAQAVIETVSDSLLVVKDDGRIRFANPVAAEVLGARAGRSFAEVFADPEEAAAFLGGALREGVHGVRRNGLEVDLVRADGTPLPAVLSLSPLDLGGTSLPSVVVLVHDVSALKAAEREAAAARDAAEAASHSKTMFLASTSHELRTPLNAIIGYSQYLSEVAEEEEATERQRDLRRIETSAQYLLKLIDDVLDLAKVEQGRLEVLLETFDVGPLVAELRPLAEELCRRNGNTWVSDDAAAGLVHADRARVRQVVLNLVSNAAKFTDRGEVRLAVQRAEDGVRIDVTDSGIGMDPDQLGKLFGEFAQVHKGGKERYGGTGLGLALSRRLCRLLEGDLTVSSVAGQGSTFTVRLPPARGRTHSPSPARRER